MRIGIIIQWNKNENIILIPVFGLSVELTQKYDQRILISLRIENEWAFHRLS